MGSLMGNEPWPIGVCPCPNGSRNKKKYIFFNLQTCGWQWFLIFIHLLFFFQKVKLTYEYSAKYQPINERELLPLPGVPKNLVFRKSRIWPCLISNNIHKNLGVDNKQKLRNRSAKAEALQVCSICSFSVK